jgi:NAD(P)-dependent dehydrogenase (short-subunit alcohol dehydrogenase family)
MEQVAERAIREFGSFDTWVNNAGVAIFGTVEQIPLEDHRRLFDTNYFVVSCMDALWRPNICASAAARSSTWEAC